MEKVFWHFGSYGRNRHACVWIEFMNAPAQFCFTGNGYEEEALLFIKEQAEHCKKEGIEFVYGIKKEVLQAN